jgi:hypothetical protein
MAPASPNERQIQIRPTSWIFLAGILFYGLYTTKTYFLPEHFPQRQFVNTVLHLLSTIFLTGCAFFSVRELFCKTAHHRLHFYQIFGAGMLVFLLFFTDYAEYVAINREINKFENQNNFLPYMIEKAQIDENPEARKLCARAAYLVYGVKISFRGDDNHWINYDPPFQEVADRKSMDRVESSLKNLRVISLGLLYGAANVIYSMFFTFFICLLWAALKLNDVKSVQRMSP